MSEQQSIRDDIATATHAWRDHAIDGTPLGERPICNCYDYADHILASPVIRRIQAEAWDVGFDAHDQDWKHHDANSWGDEDCIDATHNPYRDEEEDDD